MATTAAPVIGKRKRADLLQKSAPSKKPATAPNGKKSTPEERVQAMVAQVQAEGDAEAIPPATRTALDEAPVFVQIVAGSYERVLHGISARIPKRLLERRRDAAKTNADLTSDNKVTFSDTFLFAAHASSIRCLAVSPPTESDKRYLATGSSDERINVYSVSTVPPKAAKAGGHTDKPSLMTNPTAENSRNRSLGSLIHHDRAITCLEFPAKGKLFSAAEDNTIAISRTRDWTVLSSIKAPIPKPQGRPSGDTAGPGETPAGINDFAIHPSQKLMLSVGRGERCLRLWNLMTGKKAGVLQFERDLLVQAGEGKYSSGEGRQGLWDGQGEHYVIGFERGAAVFGIDSKAVAVVKPEPGTKLHQMRMVRVGEVGGAGVREALAVATEDGRLLFFDPKEPGPGDEAGKLPLCRCFAQLGGRSAGVVGRIKDFEVLTVPGAPAGVSLVVTAGSDGAIRIWTMSLDEVTKDSRQVGELIGTLETGNRITCVGAFVMDGKGESENVGGEDDEFAGFSEEDGEEEASE